MPLRSHSIHIPHRTLWYLAFGFGAVVLLLLISAALLLQAVQSAGTDSQRYSAQQLARIGHIDKLQLEQTSVGELLYAMEGSPGPARLAAQKSESRHLREEINRLVDEAGPESPEAWRNVRSSALLLFDSVDASLGGSSPARASIALNHRRFVASVARLLDSSYQEAVQLRAANLSSFAQLFNNSALLLGGAVIFAITGTIGAIFFSFRLFGKLETQAHTLRHLALHILDEQEQSARRFSQELHDEFGQTLNAIESTLSVVHANSADGDARLEDVKGMVKEAIANAREMARLLRPSILDDFGLDASLRELARGFSQRTGIVVDYSSNLRGRLPAGVETHLYRLAQEALTNVSRHSSAKRVFIEIKRAGAKLDVCITDDGEGMPAPKAATGSLGLIGMAERANALGGSISIRNAPPLGLRIAVSVPIPEEPAKKGVESELPLTNPSGR